MLELVATALISITMQGMHEFVFEFSLVMFLVLLISFLDTAEDQHINADKSGLKQLELLQKPPHLLLTSDLVIPCQLLKLTILVTLMKLI